MPLRLTGIYEDMITPKKPYNFRLTAMCYASPWDFDGERAYIIFRTASRTGCVMATQRDEEVTVRIFAEKPDDELIEHGLKVARHVLALDEDLTEYYKIIEKDPLLGIIPKKYLGLHMRAVASLWEGAIIGICQQNASFRQGWRMVMNLRNLLGEKVLIEGFNVILKATPSPHTIVRRASKLAETGVGYRKDTIIRLARTFIRNETEELEQIKGIGQYTARLARIIALRKYDVFPVDRWFMRLIPYTYKGIDKAWPKGKVEKLARELWGKWCGLSAILITIVTAAKPIREALDRIRKGEINILPEEPAPMTIWRVGWEI